MKKIIKTMTLFQWTEVMVVVICTLIFTYMDRSNDWWYLILNGVASIGGILCVVLCAAGKKSQYYWGFLNIVAYVVVAWSGNFYGQVMLNALYYLPTQFIGLYFWNKHMNENKQVVKTKKMSLKQILGAVILSGTLIYAYQMLLARLNGRETWLDSSTTVLSLTANAWMVLRYREQWILWIIVDIITVIMWIKDGNPVMITMWAAYLINAIYGWFVWSKMNKENLLNE